MSRERLNRKFDCFWLNTMSDEEKFVRSFTKEELGILNRSLSLYVEQLTVTSKGYKKIVNHNVPDVIDRKMRVALTLMNQMLPHQIFPFHVLAESCFNFTEDDRETG